jgi:hypothetical protein
VSAPAGPAPRPANVYVPASCPDATQLEWPARAGERWTQLVLQPGCVRIDDPPHDASQLRARCVSLDAQWNVTPRSEWVSGRGADARERASLCVAAAEPPRAPSGQRP